jgi:hypothetical protein
MTTEVGKFVIDDGQTDLVTIVDVASAAAFNGVIVHALREGLRVTYQRPGEVIQIKAPAASKPVNVKPAPKAHKAAQQPAKARAGKHRTKKAAAADKPATDDKPAWKQGDVVFIAWRSLTETERKTFDDIREAMGTVETLRRGTGIRRTVGVKWDVRDDIEWHHPADLSDVCEYCHDERGLDEVETTEDAGELVAAGA